jgi:hypothetical protein
MQRPMQISEYAPALADLQKLSLERQSQLFLARLAVLYKWNPNNCPINKNDGRQLELPGDDKQNSRSNDN